MIGKWITRKRQKPARDRSMDYNRHYRVAQRIKLRLDDAADRGDLDRVKVLIRRLRRVRDIQLRELGR